MKKGLKMIESLNHFSQYWTEIIITATIQNSVYLLFIISILYLFRDRDARILRIIALFGLIKLLIPPLISSSLIQELNIPEITSFSLMAIVDNTQLANEAITLTLQSKLMIVWVLITSFILLLSIFNTFRFRSNFRQAVLTDINKYYSGPRHKSIQFYTSSLNHSPIVFGFFKIKIILPRDWEKWSNHQKRTVIIHELNHINQNDHWINILKLLAFSIHFFNPFVWILLKRLNDLNELVCDDSTIANTKTSTIDYTKQLLHFSESYANNNLPMPSTLTFTDSYKSLKIRLSYHLSKKEGISMQNFKLKSRLTTLFCLIVMIPLLGQCNKEQPVPTSNPQIEEAKSEYDNQLAGPHSFEEVTVKPVLLNKVLPTYPVEARKEGLKGKVIVTVAVDENGDVVEAKIASSDNQIFNNTSLEAAKKCKFKPAEIDGQLVKVILKIPFQFALK